MKKTAAGKRPDEAPSAVVFGATVAAWASAQRLAERGFRVAVVADGAHAPDTDARATWAHRRDVAPFAPDGPAFPRTGPLPEASCAEPVLASFRHLRGLLADIPATARRSVLDTMSPRPWIPLGAESEPLAIFLPSLRPRGAAAPDSFIDGARAFAAAGHQLQDGHTFIARVLRFLTSCPRRRALECEATSMLDYLRGASVSSSPRFNYSERFLSELRGLPDLGLALGLAPDRDEARAVLDAYVQWLASTGVDASGSASAGADPDAGAADHGCVAFAAPLRDAWFLPWRRHLRALGVRFLDGQLRKLELVRARGGRNGAAERVRAVVAGCAATTRALVRDADYLVIATDADQARAVCANLPPVGVPGELRELTAAARWRRTGELLLFLPFALELRGPLPVKNSAWRLVARQQSLFNPRPPTLARDGYGSVVSVRIEAWDAPAPKTGKNGGKNGGKTGGKTAAACEPRELAREVWSQLAPALTAEHARRPPLWFARGPSGATLNVLPGDWSHRPGGHPASPPSAPQWGRLVFAGDYLKTFTRAPGWEAACESALRATLAITTHARVAPPPAPAPQPTIVDPESHEPPAFVPLKTLDEWCLQQQLPHIFEITGLDGWLSIASWLAFLYPATLPFLRSVLDLGDQFPTANTAGAKRSTSYQEAGLRILRKMREALENRPR